jgi:hypothetical protein
MEFVYFKLYQLHRASNTKQTVECIFRIRFWNALNCEQDVACWYKQHSTEFSCNL